MACCLPRKYLQNHGSSISSPSQKYTKNLRCNSGLGDTNEATNSAKTTKIPSSQPEKSKARVSDISFSEPSLKRPRPSHESQDDDIIEEIPPSIVKQEVGDQSQATPGSSSRQVRPAPTQHDYQLTDPGQYDETADYAEEYGYEDEMGYAEGVLDPNQAKGKKH